MNIFKTVPAFMKAVSEIRRFDSHGPEIEAARATGDDMKTREVMIRATSAWAENTANRLGIEIEVDGEENIPENGPVLIVSNHQGYFDPVALYYAIRKFQYGFITKSEFAKYKMLVDAANYSGALFLIRGGGREAIQTLNKATELFEKGYSIAIFPEGTRSHGPEMNEFKPGSFKFAQKGKASILPVTLNGSYHVFEEKNSFQRCKVKVTIHPLVHYEQMDRHQQNEAHVAIEETIRNAVDANY